MNRASVERTDAKKTDARPPCGLECCMPNRPSSHYCLSPPMSRESSRNPGRNGATGNIARRCMKQRRPRCVREPLCANSERSPKQRAILSTKVFSATLSRRASIRPASSRRGFPGSCSRRTSSMNVRGERSDCCVHTFRRVQFLFDTDSTLRSCEHSLREARLSRERSNLWVTEITLCAMHSHF